MSAVESLESVLTNDIYGRTIQRRGANMRRQFHVLISREERLFVAQCLDVDVASQGETEEEAMANLTEALQLYFEDAPQARPIVRELTVELPL